MKRLRVSGLCLELFVTYICVAGLALALLSTSILWLIDRERGKSRVRDAEYMAQVIQHVDALQWTSEQEERAFLVRTGVGRALLMSPKVLKAFRSEGEPPEILFTGEMFRRTALERPTFLPMEPSPVPEEVRQEVTAALRTLTPQQMTRLTSQAQLVTVCPPVTRGTGVNCAVLLPHEPRPPVAGFVVALLPAGPLDAIYDTTLAWLLPLGGVLVLLAVAIAWHMALRITTPLHEIQRVAERVASGDLSTRAGGIPQGEMGRVVTVLNQALDRLAAARAQQGEIDRERRDLVASVSHEFRAPLASLRGYLELLQNGVIPANQCPSKYVSIMLSDTLRLNRLLEDLLEWSRLQANPVTLQPMPTDPLDACHRVTEQLHWQAGAGGLELVLDLPPRVPLVLADPDRLDQVLVNLLQNALRYAGRGGWIRVSAAASEDGQMVRFAVVDSGPGIPYAEQSRIWERFYKVDKARTPGEGGSGLGLPIVKQLVEAMGGQVGLVSQPGQGSTFWFTLPVARQLKA